MRIHGRDLGLQNPVTPIQSLLIVLLGAFLCEFILQEMSPELRTISSMTSRIAVVFVSLYAIQRFAETALASYRPTLKDCLLFLILIVGSALVVRAVTVLNFSLSAYSKQFNYLGGISSTALAYSVPYAFGALLLQTVLGLHSSLVFLISFGIIIGVYPSEDPFIVPFALASSLVACLSISHLRTRSAYTRAGFYVALTGLIFAIASFIVGKDESVGDLLARVTACFVGGVLCSFLAAGISPVIEFLGGYVTDLRLIEIATLDHPLLKQLSVQAPGTWNHSMVMGMMAESAADSIGANATAARVGAYFHDIGKIKKPLYFVENQSGGENRHDKLSSSMSALIIRSHVKDGIELGDKHRLPQVIMDMIPQHHGTSLIEYFYEKALREAREVHGEEADVDESLYRYPGPKPQTREAGILMLADGIEAAARTLAEPDPDRIQGMVQKLINKVFASGQLDECELTLKDLHLIAKCFTRVLGGIYHERIAYAEPAEKGHEKDSEEHAEVPKEVANQSATKKGRAGHKDKDAEGETKEDLKRLGI